MFAGEPMPQNGMRFMPFSVFVWWLLLVWGAGWLAFPLAERLVGHALPDGGLALGRIAFLVSWSVLAFWLGRAGVPVAASAWLYGVLLVASLALWWGERRNGRIQWKSQRRALVGVEAAFLATFLVFWTLRGFWSDTSGTNGEKGMDSVLVATLARAQKLPPPNPYAAGARLESYYVLGHLEAALLTRATGTTTRWSYNLMCATLPALCVSALFSLGAGLTRKIGGGLFVSFAVLGLGTLQPLFAWAHPDAWSATRFLRLDFFAVSRVQPYAINEFPWFSFNQADLHAHYFDFPLEIALMALAWALYQARGERRRLGLLGACSFFLGAQILTNTWDFPAFALLVGLAFALAPRARTAGTSTPSAGTNGRTELESASARTQKTGARTKTPRSQVEETSGRTENTGARKRKTSARTQVTSEGIEVVGAQGEKANAPTEEARDQSENTRVRTDRMNSWPWRVLWFCLAIAGAIGLALPYLLGINTAARGPSLLTQPASPLREWLLMWAPFLAMWWAFGATHVFRSNRRAWLGFGALGAFVILAACVGQTNWGFPEGLEKQPVPTREALSVWFASLNPARLVIPMLALCAWIAVRALRHGQSALRFAAILALAGLFALAWSETTWAGFLGDPNFPAPTDFKRQDTIFKFGLQAWFLWGTAGSVGAYLTFKRWPLALKLALVPFVLVMATSSLVDTVGRARWWKEDRARPGYFHLDFLSDWQNWDGWAHLSPGEQEAARWLETHALPGQNILEAEQKEGGDFSVYTRFTHTTGIPTIIGPQSHTFYWSPSPLRLTRRADESADEFLGRRAGTQYEEVFKRKAEARAAFTTPDAAKRLEILRRYGVRYVVWGDLERAQYGQASRAFLERDLRLRASFGFEAGEDPSHRVEIWEVP